MRAYVVERLGTPGALSDLQPTPAGPREILVHVTVAGVNPIDWKIRDGLIGERPTPLVLGQDFAGFVERSGDRTSGFKPGDRVFGIARSHGSYAEYTVVPIDVHAEPVAKTPEWLSDAQAAALPTAGLTALAALAALNVQRDQTLLVIGVTGGVGGFATQMARARGAHVLGTAHTGKEGLARMRGAENVISYDRQDITEAVRSACPNGVDAVLDLVSDAESIKKIATIVRPGGKLISTVGAVDEAWFAHNNRWAKNIVLSETPQCSPDGLEELARLVKENVLQIPVVEKPLAEAEDILAQSKAGEITGKVVLTI